MKIPGMVEDERLDAGCIHKIGYQPTNIKKENYQEKKWEDLLGLWRHFNHHLVHTIRSVDPACLTHVWVVDTDTRYSLFELITDYLRHLEDHLNQVDENLKATV